MGKLKPMIGTKMKSKFVIFQDAIKGLFLMIILVQLVQNRPIFKLYPADKQNVITH